MAVAAIIAAVLLGGTLAGQRVEYINPTQPTAFRRAGGTVAVPDVIGTSLAEAREVLSRFNLSLVVQGTETTGGPRMIVTGMDPAPGALVGYGSPVVVRIAPASSLVPGPTATAPQPQPQPTSTSTELGRAATTTAASAAVTTVAVTVPVATTTPTTSSDTAAVTTIPATVTTPSSATTSTP